MAAGAWLGGLAGTVMRDRLQVTRQVLHWFPVADVSAWRLGRSPSYVWTYGSAPGEQFYGFPPIAGEVKVARESNATADPDDTFSDPGRDLREQAAIRGHVEDRLAGLAPNAPSRWESCLYTTTPDRDFLVGHDPEHAAIRFVSACSGHGFKHSAAIGQALAAEWAQDGSGLSLAPFSDARFSRS